jgi:hypothetical protein
MAWACRGRSSWLYFEENEENKQWIMIANQIVLPFDLGDARPEFLINNYYYMAVWRLKILRGSSRKSSNRRLITILALWRRGRAAIFFV